VKEAPVYPNITFINNFKAYCLSFKIFFIFAFLYKPSEFLIIILDIKNYNSILGNIPSLISFLTKATLLGVIKILPSILLLASS
jgi:hypothetical protein